jgi:hypothetical protein
VRACVWVGGGVVGTVRVTVGDARRGPQTLVAFGELSGAQQTQLASMLEQMARDVNAAVQVCV